MTAINNAANILRAQRSVHLAGTCVDLQLTGKVQHARIGAETTYRVPPHSRRNRSWLMITIDPWRTTRRSKHSRLRKLQLVFAAWLASGGTSRSLEIKNLAELTPCSLEPSSTAKKHPDTRRSRSHNRNTATSIVAGDEFQCSQSPS